MRQWPPAEAVLGPDLLARWPLPDHEHDDKYARGTVLVIGGSAETPGAVLLAGTAALRVGAGRLQIATVAAVAPAVAVAMPEARVVALNADAVAGVIEQADAIVVGPGLDPGGEVVELVSSVVEHASPTAIVVLDAAAIPAIGQHRAAIAARDGQVVITPNREELALLGFDGDDPVRAAAAAHAVTVTSFGRVVAPDGRAWRDPNEPCGLGTSGAGDVLAGAVAGLASRCRDAAQAACWATAAHRVASQRLAGRRARVGYLARELADEMAAALESLGSVDPPDVMWG